MNGQALKQWIGNQWDAEIVPALMDYIRIPNQSPAFDADWAAHGHMDKAVKLLASWARGKLAGIDGASLEVVRLDGRTPVIFIEVPASGAPGDDTVLLYGHLDKQPEMTGWAEGLDAWTPVLRDDRLYGRGGADDGYALFASLTALLALHEQHQPHARAVILIEACEESGSYDLPFYVEQLAARIGQPSLVVCLDSGCANYEQLWLTTSLRGMVAGTLEVQVLTEGVHSGDASGIVPDSFRLIRQLLARIENPLTGRIELPEIHADIPPERKRQAADCAAILGAEVAGKFPWAGNTRPTVTDAAQQILARTWEPQLAVTGADGLPPIASAGNVLRPRTALKLSLRLPPNINAELAGAVVKDLLEERPPQGASVSFTLEKGADGWDAPTLEDWLAGAVETASREAFGAPAAYMGEGGTIPFMAMLGERFPQAQFLITGVLGPHSNAHGPNEFLHVPTGKKVTEVVARILAAHAAR